MESHAAASRSLCLLNEQAYCNPIWVAKPEGLKLSHFPTLQKEMTGRQSIPADSEYDRCERECQACSQV